MSPRLAMLCTHRLYYCSTHVSHVYLSTTTMIVLYTPHNCCCFLMQLTQQQRGSRFSLSLDDDDGCHTSHTAHSCCPSLTSPPELVLDIRSYKLTPQNHTSTACNLDCLCLIVTLTAARCQYYWLDQRIILLLLLLRSVLFCITCA